MPTYSIDNINSTDLATTYAGISTISPWLFPAILFFEFCVIMFSGVYAQNRKVGFSNIPMWGSIAGLVTTTTAFFWSAVSGIINLDTIGVCIGITIGFSLWFFLSDME